MKKNNIILASIVLIVFVIAMQVFFSGEDGKNISSAAKLVTSEATKSVTNEKGDMKIPISSITEDATFYSYDELDSKMEVIAVKASDGTIRTAFNTCQVCHDSGRGYYIQEGDQLVCQNCGNSFSMDQVELAQNGCNPVPIFDEQIKMNSDEIIIPKEFLKDAEGIFKSWKS